MCVCVLGLQCRNLGLEPLNYHGTTPGSSPFIPLFSPAGRYAPRDKVAMPLTVETSGNRPNQSLGARAPRLRASARRPITRRKSVRNVRPEGREGGSTCEHAPPGTHNGCLTRAGSPESIWARTLHPPKLNAHSHGLNPHMTLGTSQRLLRPGASFYHIQATSRAVRHMVVPGRLHVALH